MPSIKHTDVNLGLGQYRMVGTDYKIIGKKIGKSLILYVSKCSSCEKDKIAIKEALLKWGYFERAKPILKINWDIQVRVQA